MKHEIWEEKYFSNKFHVDVESFDYFQEINESIIEKTKVYEDDSLTTDIPIERINQGIRKQLHRKFLEDFSTLIKNMTNEKSKEIEISLLETFTTAVLGSEDSLMFDEVEESSKLLIKKLTSDIAHNEGRFTYLIERFSRDIFDILILFPLLSEDRNNKFRIANKEFMYLNNYYAKADGALINIILSGENKSMVQGVDTLLTLANKLISSHLGNNSYNVIAEINNNSYNVIAEINEVMAKLKQFSSNDSLQVNFDISKITEGKTRSTTELEVLTEINNDIINLKDVLQVAIVPAINLELAFFNSIDKQIKVLIDSFQSTDTEGAKMFDDFISKIVPKIKSSEINNINQKIESYKLQKEVLKEMNDFRF